MALSPPDQVLGTLELLPLSLWWKTIKSQISSNVFIFAVVIAVGIEALRDNRHCKLGAVSKMCKSSSQCIKSSRLPVGLFLTEIAGKLLACLIW